jgi:ubiquinone/menaquinone biosynthesis C-methylase UbiE
MTVELRLALQERRAEELERRVRRLLGPFTGSEIALDSGCGTGALAAALAAHVGKVIGADTNLEYLDAARELAIENAEFVEGDATKLPFEYGRFDLSGCIRVLHHVHRPELAVSELARVTRPGGRILIADQLGSIDPLRSLELDRFERARDPSHQRLLPDADVRGYLDANDLVLVSFESEREQVDLEERLELAGVPEADRERVRGLAPSSAYDVEVGWYVARKPAP